MKVVCLFGYSMNDARHKFCRFCSGIKCVVVVVAVFSHFSTKLNMQLKMCPIHIEPKPAMMIVLYTSLKSNLKQKTARERERKKMREKNQRVNNHSSKLEFFILHTGILELIVFFCFVIFFFSFIFFI